MNYKVEEKLDDIDKLLSINKSAQEAVLYRKYLNDKLSLEKKFARKEKAVKTAKTIINAAYLMTNWFRKNPEHDSA